MWVFTYLAGQGDDLARAAWWLSALPCSSDALTVLHELSANGCVPSCIRDELALPELLAELRCAGGAAPLLTMPSTAMHEESGKIIRLNEIGSTVERLKTRRNQKLRACSARLNASSGFVSFP